MAGLNFRVLLDSAKNQDVFRDILISDELNFEQFYLAVLDAFGFENDQMASFFVSDEQWGKGEEISLLNMNFDNSDEEVAPIQMNQIKLKERIKSHITRFILVHDFLSMWIFLIELQETNDYDGDTPQLLVSVGEISEELRNSKENRTDDFQFEPDFNWEKEFDDDDFDDFDEFDNDFFEDIDDFDI
ncbi:MAG: hypothetical protein WC994_01485 [Brumimicrobium sp.]